MIFRNDDHSLKIRAVGDTCNLMLFNLFHLKRNLLSCRAPTFPFGGIFYYIKLFSSVRARFSQKCQLPQYLKEVSVKRDLTVQVFSFSAQFLFSFGFTHMWQSSPYDSEPKISGKLLPQDSIESEHVFILLYSQNFTIPLLSFIGYIWI